MVDFSKRLGKKVVEKPVEPKAIYERLDRASDKGPLREAQKYILDRWHAEFRNRTDVVVKLHTGQGKTLIGLLILQSKLNEGVGPALYLCPNVQLVQQTCEQAKQFGITVIEAGEDVPSEYLEGKAIWVTTTAKLFNGRTKFKLAPRSLPAGVVLMDDSHACVDSIRDAISIKLSNDHPVYAGLLSIFQADLEQQGAGTFEDIRSGKHDVLLPVPYWAWRDKVGEVTALLAKHSEVGNLGFVWPILKDRLPECLCLMSGTSLEIVPYLAPLDLFGTYWDSKHRVFMSATVTDDSFLIKGLRLSKESITNPLSFPNEKWSGEKMILVPSLIHDDLERTEVVNHFAPPDNRRRYGVVALASSFIRTVDWEKLGAVVAQKNTIDFHINNLKLGQRNQAVVLVNRYDGIDLADDQCRILVFDSLPHGENLYDRYMELCRPGSDLLNIRLARSVEQGLGRSVRGEKDYSVIIITGPELVRFLRQPNTRSFLSEQTRKQVEIGLQVSELAKEDHKSESPIAALTEVYQQCLKRDENWKEFYFQEMETLSSTPTAPRGLQVFEAELNAETQYQNHNPDGAVSIIQSLADDVKLSGQERGFYVQEMARYRYSGRRVESMRLQIAAHTRNRFLLRPPEGSQVQQLKPLPGERIANIIQWVRKFPDFEHLKVCVDDIFTRLQFGTAAEDFELAIHEMGQALGFSSERPDKEWKAGPDNLWCLRDNDYLLMECKSKVQEDRVEITKDEAGQLNNAYGWFKQEYPGARCTRILIIPTHKTGNGAAFTDAVGIMRKSELGKLRKNLREFFGEFRIHQFDSLDERKIHEWIEAHKLTVENLMADYQKETYAGTIR